MSYKLQIYVQYFKGLLSIRVIKVGERRGFIKKKIMFLINSKKKSCTIEICANMKGMQDPETNPKLRLDLVARNYGNI